jgi:hypothetical protein
MTVWYYFVCKLAQTQDQRNVIFRKTCNFAQQCYNNLISKGLAGGRAVQSPRAAESKGQHSWQKNEYISKKFDVMRSKIVKILR